MKKMGMVLQIIFYGFVIFVLYQIYAYIKSKFTSSADIISQKLDAAAEAHGLAKSTAEQKPNLDYITARSAWYAKYGISGSDALSEAGQPGFPTRAQFASNPNIFDTYQAVSFDIPTDEITTG